MGNEGEPKKLGKLRQGFNQSLRGISLAAVVATSSHSYRQDIIPTNPPLVAPFRSDLGSFHTVAAPVKPPGQERYGLVLPDIAADGNQDPNTEPHVDAASAPQNELSSILEKAQANPDLPYIFNRGLTMDLFLYDLNVYYPIFKAAGEVYDVPPSILMTIFWEESTGSRNPGSNINNNAMQTSDYSAQYLYDSFYGTGKEYLMDTAGLENLEDPIAIFGGAHVLAEKIKSHGGTLLGGMQSYGPDAKARMGMAEQLQIKLGIE